MQTVDQRCDLIQSTKAFDRGKSPSHFFFQITIDENIRINLREALLPPSALENQPG